MMRMRQHIGVTLVELIAVLIVVGVVASMAANMVGKSLQSYLIGSEASDNAAQAQLAMARLTRELRTVRSATIGDLTPAANQITFVEQSSGTTVGYNLAGTTLYRTVTPSGVPVALADNISGLAFSYLTADGRVALTSPSTSVSLIYYISARLTVTSANLSLGFGTTVKPAAF